MVLIYSPSRTESKHRYLCSPFGNALRSSLLEATQRTGLGGEVQSQQRENRMSLSPRSVAIGATLVGIMAFIAGGIVAFRGHAPGRVPPMWPLWLMGLATVVVSILLAIQWRRRRRSN